MSIRDIVSNDCIDLDIKYTTKKEILEELIKKLHKSGFIADKDKFYEDLCFREKEGSTSIGNYIAIPHGQSSYVKRFSIAIGRTNLDVQWEDEDNFPVRLIILFAVPDSGDSKDELRTMAQMCRKLADDDLCYKLLKSQNYDEIVEIFS
ncbi:PTS sugar transporter subunit IIA [Terrisporobacter glycolicus]|uniref:PTS system mannose-specific EIIBCA component n=1 Tax=Terrisporobacter glycolicus ATCC 14880 = DSM 1288 TaxID=1121315 RepID=A0ABZ2ESD4_9FIRM|nr:fructose PTS transporter subunit IIA [Terrisporobacter glycolicus]